MSFIDRFTSTHRLSAFQTAKKSARVDRGVQHESPERPLSIDDTIMILKYGKEAWRGLNRNGAVTYTPEGWPIVPRCR